MDFEWDENKRHSNLAKHGVDLLEAALIFEGPVFFRPDDRDYAGEVRYKAIGMVDDACFVLIYTERNGAIRLISAWKGGRRDRAEYQTRLAERNPPDEGQG